MAYLWILFGLVLLIFGGNLLVDGSVGLARKMKVSPLLIGLVLVGFGTSTPELLTSLIAVYKGAEGITIGNVVGSNIANILLVLGMAAVLRPVPVHKKSLKRDGMFLILSTVVLVLALLGSRIGLCWGLVMCGTLMFYVCYAYKTEKQMPEIEAEQDASFQRQSWALFLFKTIVGIALTLYGARLLVDNAVIIATIFGVETKVIGLTLVAVGTSLPELMTSIVASFKKQSDVALGNVIGSNIFNALFILGLTALFMPIQVPEKMMVDICVMVLATLLMLAFGLMNRTLGRKIGVLFLMLYIGYITYLGVFS